MQYEYGWHMFVTWFALMDRQLVRHPYMVCCFTQSVQAKMPYIFIAVCRSCYAIPFRAWVQTAGEILKSSCSPAWS
jgi:hypothetical protein